MRLVGILLACSPAFALPLDQAVNFAGWPVLFAMKMGLCFTAVSLLLWGLGALVWAPKEAKAVPETAVHILARMLLGLFAIGLLTFGTGLIISPTWAPLLSILLGVCGLGLRGTALEWDLRNILRHSIAWARDLTAAQRACVALLALLFLVRSIDLLDFHGHEDSYLYHLSLAEIWMRQGHTGIALDNVTSGYAWVVEHFYLFVRQIARGAAEQNALAQLSHFFIGFGLFFWGMLHVLTLRNRWTPILLAWIFANAHFLSFLMLPKNDGILLGALTLTLVGFYERRVSWFLLGCLCVGSIKITGAISLVALGLVGIGRMIWQRESMAKDGALLGLGAFAALVGCAPFMLQNAWVTGNPVFPLANNIFRSPYGPSSFQSIVAEMQPLSITFEEWFRSKVWLLRKYYGLVLVPFIWIGTIEPLLIFILAFAAVDFGLLSLALGPAGLRVEDRHFLIAIGPSLALVVLAIDRLRAKSLQVGAMGLLACAALAQTGFEVQIKDAKRFFAKTQLTEDLLNRKPLMAINARLNALPSPVHVLALTHANTAFFLTNGRFWHETTSYPVLLWDMKRQSTQDWRAKIAHDRITHIVIEREHIADYPGLGPLLSHAWEYEGSLVFATEYATGLPKMHH